MNLIAACGLAERVRGGFGLIGYLFRIQLWLWSSRPGVRRTVQRTAGDPLSGSAPESEQRALLEYPPHNSLCAFGAPLGQTRRVRWTKACQCAALLRLACGCASAAPAGCGLQFIRHGFKRDSCLCACRALQRPIGAFILLGNGAHSKAPPIPPFCATCAAPPETAARGCAPPPGCRPPGEARGGRCAAPQGVSPPDIAHLDAPARCRCSGGLRR